MTFAQKTKVPISQTVSEIRRTLDRYKAASFAYFEEKGRAIIMFECASRRVRFDLPLPHTGNQERDAQQHRAKWRALLLCIKAKLESVESNIETFEEAFMAHVVMPDGKTVSEHIRPEIAQAYQTGNMVPLLPGKK